MPEVRHADVDRRIAEDLRDLQNLVGGFEFAEVVRAFYRAFVEKDDALQAAALRWLRGEYTTKTEAREDLGVRRIIDDDSFYDAPQVNGSICAKGRLRWLAGKPWTKWLCFLTGSPAPKPASRILKRRSPFSRLLPGTVAGWIHFSGIYECLEDKRRGLFSYEALRSRLAENVLARANKDRSISPVLSSGCSRLLRRTCLFFSRISHSSTRAAIREKSRSPMRGLLRRCAKPARNSGRIISKRRGM